MVMNLEDQFNFLCALDNITNTKRTARLSSYYHFEYAFLVVSPAALKSV
jgi:hypothetical protein